MRDLTNLPRPDQPFGAGQPPFGGASKIICAFDLQSAPDPPGALRCVAAVYVRITNGVAAPVEAATLQVGFRVSIAEDPEDADELLEVLDVALSRARRHAALLAGHHLDTDLGPLVHASGGRWPGVTAVLGAWPHRPTTDEGFAQIVDTADQARVGRLDVNLSAQPAAATDPLELAQATLARCLAVALKAGASSDRLRWQGRFPVHETLRHAGWDILKYRKTTPT